MQNSQTPSLTRPVISPHKAFSFVVTWTTVWWISESLKYIKYINSNQSTVPLDVYNSDTVKLSWFDQV